jgi:hypothetical protein
MFTVVQAVIRFDLSRYAIMLIHTIDSVHFRLFFFFSSLHFPFSLFDLSPRYSVIAGVVMYCVGQRSYTATIK